MVRNKTIKQMLVDVVLQGRKAIWYGEETEIFACKSVEQLEAEFKEGCLKEMRECLEAGERSDFARWANWKGWWRPCVFERRSLATMKGKPVCRRDGSIAPYLESLPIICSINGGADDIVLVSTSYN